MTTTTLRQAPQSGVCLNGNYTSVPLNHLRVSVTLRYPIYDPCGVLLVASGLSLTDVMLERLKNRGILMVRIHRDEADFLCHGSRNHSPNAKDESASKVSQSGYQSLIEQRFRGLQSDIACQTGDIHSALLKGRPLHFEAAEALAKESYKSIKVDQDLILSFTSTDQQETLAEHSTKTATLAMSIAKTMGVSIRDTLALGAGCLLHDSGMLKLREGTREAERKLTPSEFLEVTKHVAACHDMVSAIKDMPLTVRRVAVEIHERFDGRGYPRSKAGAQLHPMSRIAAVADCFAGMVSARPYREAIPHYQAMQYLLYRTKTGRFDPVVVKALLETVSLFPIGSYVRLNDGRTGRVIRANGTAYMKPVVAIANPQGDVTAEFVDLSKSAQLSVLETLPTLKA
ncbi:MAG: HD domain-containing phosphohydrolase [Planctomycetales bacterium]